MSRIYESILELIGNTPIIHLNKIEKKEKLLANLYAKVESFNPGGSTKDRMALRMVEAAEEEGLLKEGYTIVEGSSGNTGIGLALVAAYKGYDSIICMSESSSEERFKLVSAYGGHVVKTPKKNGFIGGGNIAEDISAQIPNSFRPCQGKNMNNPDAHFRTTGPEIWRDMDGNVDIFVASVGTGGTSTGTGHYLRSVKPDVQIIGVEPAGSPILSGGEPGPHKIQGIGGGAICDTTDLALYNEFLRCTDDDAYEFARWCGKEEGILIGISAGAALWGAIEVAKREENRGKNIVVLFPDGGEKYLSTDLYEENIYDYKGKDE